jgi:hypothetical protein
VRCVCMKSTVGKTRNVVSYVDLGFSSVVSTKFVKVGVWAPDEYLAHKKPPPPRTLQWSHPSGPMVVLACGRFPMRKVSP